MVKGSMIFFAVCTLIFCGCQAQGTDIGPLNITVHNLFRKTDSLQREVDDLWGKIVSSDVHVQEYGNKTRADNVDDYDKECVAKVDNAVNTVKELKSEVKHLVLTSRAGIKNEKKRQRETVSNLTNIYENFQAGVTAEIQNVKHHHENIETELVRIDESCNIKLETINDAVSTVKELKSEVKHFVVTSRAGIKNEKKRHRETVGNLTNIYENFQAGVTAEIQNVKHHHENIETELVRIDESCNIKLETINKELNERTNGTWNELGHIRKVLDSFSENQNKLETKNQALSQTITEMQNDYKDMENKNLALSQTITDTTDSLQREVDDILGKILSSDIRVQEYGNKTRADNVDYYDKECVAKVDDAVITVKELKSEVKHLVVTSRAGIKTEKKRQRETVRNLTNIYENFQAGVTAKIKKVKHHHENIETELVRIDESCNNKLETINTELNERTNETWNELGHIRTVLDSFSENQNKLENKNQVLSQT